jgi:predicted NBD/HSP70 family sugar kinase
MAAGEALTLSPDELPMIYLKLGMSLGCGLVLADGTVFHGRDGGAGDIAHIRAPGNSGELCACGNLGCVEVVASTSAILNRLEGTPGLTADRPRNSWTLLELLERGDPHALRATREAAAVIGEATVLLVHLLNPATILIGGPLGTDDVIASIRGTVYQRAPSLLTRSLRIRAAPLGTYSGVTGGLRRAIEIALTPDQLTRLTDVTTGATGGHGAVPAPAQ